MKNIIFLAPPAAGKGTLSEMLTEKYGYGHISTSDLLREEIKNKDSNLKGQMVTQGKTPRRITDLIGSLCDLTSGSGDKGTPIVYIQGYFDNYADN